MRQKIFKVYYEASVGAAYIRAKSFDAAVDKLDASRRNVDTKDVRFDSWEPEVFDVDHDHIEELAGDDLKTARRVMFGRDL